MHVEGSRAIEDDVTINKDRIDNVEACRSDLVMA